MAVLMFLVPRTSGGGAEKVIVSLASRMAEKHQVYLVTTVREDGVESYPCSSKVVCYNVYRWVEDHKSDAVCEAAGKPENSVANRPEKLLLRIRKRMARWAKSLPDAFVDPVREQVQNADLAFQIRIVREMKQAFGVDCAISFLNSANYINVMSCSGERTLVSVRSYPESRYAPADNWTESGRAKIRTVSDRADIIVPVAKEIADCLTEIYEIPAEKMQVIYNWVDLEQISRKRDLPLQNPWLEKALAEAEFVFVSTGRLTEKKGQWHLIRAFRTVLQSHPGALLVIPGREGKGRDNVADFLRSVIGENGLTGRVLLPGWCDNPYALLSRCDVFVETSFNEGFPNALAEAMAMGLPVISTDCRSGPREILAPDTDYAMKTCTADFAEYGILVPECSGNHLMMEPLEPEEEILAKAMISLIKDRDLWEHYRKKSLERALCFSKEGLVAQWQRLIGD